MAASAYTARMQLPQGGASRAGSPVTRWLLPLLLAAAVLAMHGLGHPSGHGHMGGMPAVHAATSLHVSPLTAPARLPAVAGPATSSTGINGLAGLGGLDPVAVCLAVLAGTILLLISLRRRRVRLPSAGRTPGGWASVQLAARPPPGAPALAALQVLRL